MTEGASFLDRIPAPALFIVSSVSLYVGAGLAVSTFDEVRPESVAWLRVAASAVVLAVLVRPWRLEWSRIELRTAAAFGTVLACMNLTFYLAAARVHLGSTVAIEFLGPITVAAWSTRSRAGLAAVAVAGGGVAMLGIGLRTDPVGLAWTLLAAVCWGGYVVLGHRVSRQRSGIEGLAVALAFGAVVTAPIGLWGTGPAWSSPRLLLTCIGVGVFSSLVPYGLDQHVLRRISRGEFALLLAILPVMATIMGLLLLSQRPRWFELVGIAAVCAGLVLQARSTARDDVVADPAGSA